MEGYLEAAQGPAHQTDRGVGAPAFFQQAGIRSGSFRRCARNQGGRPASSSADRFHEPPAIPPQAYIEIFQMPGSDDDFQDGSPSALSALPRRLVTMPSKQMTEIQQRISVDGRQIGYPWLKANPTR